MLIHQRGLFVGAILLLGGCYGQVAPLYPAQSDLTSGSLVAAGSIGIAALAASAAMVARAELKSYNCGKKLQEQKLSCDIETEEVENQLKEAKEELQLIKDKISEVENQLKEAKEELQLIKDKISACKASGYSLHPVFGCIRCFEESGGFTVEQWSNHCVENNGELLVIRSAVADQTAANLIRNLVAYVVVQGRRDTVSSPWVTNDGQPLPYIGQFESEADDPGTLQIAIKPDGKWVKTRPDTRFYQAICLVSVD